MAIIHPALRQVKAAPQYLPASGPAPGPSQYYGSSTTPPPQPPTGLTAIGAGLQTGAQNVGAAAQHPLGAAQTVANGLGIGQMPSELSWLNNPAMQSLVKRLVDSGQATDVADLQAQAAQATQRAENEAKMIQGFYDAGAQLSARMSPYYQDVLEKSANTLTGLAGAYGQSVDQLAPGQGAVFNELTGTEPASGFKLQRTAVPYGPGARGDLFSVYGPTTSDIGASNAMMRLGQGETERQQIEQKIRDLKAQKPGQYLQTLTGLGSMVMQGKQLAQQGELATGTYKGKKTLDALTLAFQKGQAIGTVNGKPTLQAKQVYETIREFDKTYTLQKAAQDLDQNKFTLTKDLADAAQTGLYHGIQTIDYKEAMIADAQRNRALDLQQQGVINDKQFHMIDNATQRYVADLVNARELMSIGETQRANKVMEGLQAQKLGLDTQIANWSHQTDLTTQAQNQQRIDAEIESNRQQAARLGQSAAFDEAYKAALLHSQGREIWSVRPDGKGGYEAYNTKTQKPLSAAQIKALGAGGKPPSASTIKGISSFIQDQGATSTVRTENKDPNNPAAGTIKVREDKVPTNYQDVYNQLYIKYGDSMPNADARIKAWIDNATDPDTGKKLYPRGANGRDWYDSTEYPHLLSGDARGKLVAAAIVKDSGGMKWVIDHNTGLSYKINSPNGMKAIAQGWQPAAQPLQPTRVEPTHPAAAPLPTPKTWKPPKEGTKPKTAFPPPPKPWPPTRTTITNNIPGAFPTPVTRPFYGQ